MKAVKEKQELYLNILPPKIFSDLVNVKEKQELYLNTVYEISSNILDLVKEKQELYLNNSLTFFMFLFTLS